jgi:hypothetical protein
MLSLKGHCVDEKAQSKPGVICPRCKKPVESVWVICPNCEAVLSGPERGSRGGALHSAAHSLNAVARNPVVLGLALIGTALPCLMLIGFALLTGQFFLIPAILGLAILAWGIALRSWKQESTAGKGVRALLVIALALVGVLLWVMSCTWLWIRGIHLSNPL